MNQFADGLKALSKELHLLDFPLFEKIKQEEYSPGHTKDGLKRFREKAINERNLRESYRGRAPYELLQNADDARARHAAYILCKEGMAFVHDGNWFTGDNFISLADGWSDKNPNECIGHKGLGFRSVLDITPSPYLVRIDPKEFFAVKFSWALNNGHIMETIRRKPEYREDYEKWKSTGQNICPIMFIPGFAKKQNLGEGANIYDRLIRAEYNYSFTTMFWLPANDDIEKRVLAELDSMPITSGSEERDKLKHFILSDVGRLIPFLRNIESVSLFEDKSRLVSVSKKNPEANTAGLLGIITEADGRIREQSFYQLRFKAPIPLQVITAPGTPRAVKVMKEASITLSVTLQDGCPVAVPKSKFHVYFPTEEDTGVGFVVHGDFYVTPDRKRLMDDKNQYNEWLLGFAAQKAAGEFLTELLKLYPPKNIFTALAPSATKGNSAIIFCTKFSESLKKRQSPYIPHLTGLARRDEVLLPPIDDPDGFLEQRFTKFLPTVSSEKFFVSSIIDTPITRNFFNLAGIREMPSSLLLDLAESVPSTQKISSWWYELFDYMSNHAAFSSMSNADLLGRKLVLANNGTILDVQDEGGTVLCFPPSTATENIAVPECLSESLVFLDMELTKSIKDGDESTESWIVKGLNISKFEANDLISRIRTIVEKLFNGNQPITTKHLVNLWVFLKEINDIARRELTSDDYWRDVGRLPLPMSLTEQNETISPNMMVPAFLMYWPEGYLGTSACLESVDRVQRVSKDFLDLLIAVTGQPVSNWVDFLQKAGVSSLPKKLKYSRSIIEDAIPLTSNGLESLKRSSFCGERQKDENLAVVSALKADGLWSDYLQSSNGCLQHSGTSKTLQSLTLLDKFIPCCNKAAAEFEHDDENWKKRLWSLIDGLEDNNELLQDRGQCGPLGQKNSHDFLLNSYMKMQLEYAPWLPSTNGPQVSSGCFARFVETRLISKGKSEHELGDLIIPYVIVSDHAKMAKLESLGIKALYNVDSTDPETLVRALRVIGEKLYSDWGRKEIIAERGRWRLVRGAIQEIYRRLNQVADGCDLQEPLKIAVKTASGISFIAGDMYYARSGSATEQAFMGVLPLIDVDRPLKDLFEKLSVTQLIAGETVTEELVGQYSCMSAPHLKNIIVDELSPYLLAVNYDKGEKEVDRFIRRLKERFDVFISESITVTVSLLSDPSIGGQIPFRNFYLSKKVVPLSGAAEEYHFSLIVEGKENTTFSDLDADALGEILTQVFMDRVTDEALGYFPRITSRFQQCYNKGDLKTMQEYLHLQLGIPLENQDNVVGLITGEYAPAQAVVIPPPPKVKIIVPASKRSDESSTAMDEMKNKHQADAAEKVTNNLNKLLVGGSSEDNSKKSLTSHKGDISVGAAKVTNEQQVRGLKGELEIKRRMMNDGGWEGFTLIQDTRQNNCGFDFLCLKNGLEVKVEVKTFAENGYISVTNKELIESGLSKDHFYLVGLLDDGNPEYGWKSFELKDPFIALTKLGKFEIETRLQVDPTVIFGIERNQQ